MEISAEIKALISKKVESYICNEKSPKGLEIKKLLGLRSDGCHLISIVMEIGKELYPNLPVTCHDDLLASVTYSPEQITRAKKVEKELRFLIEADLISKKLAIVDNHAWVDFNEARVERHYKSFWVKLFNK